MIFRLLAASLFLVSFGSFIPAVTPATSVQEVDRTIEIQIREEVAATTIWQALINPSGLDFELVSTLSTTPGSRLVDGRIETGDAVLRPTLLPAAIAHAIYRIERAGGRPVALIDGSDPYAPRFLLHSDGRHIAIECQFADPVSTEGSESTTRTSAGVEVPPAPNARFTVDVFLGPGQSFVHGFVGGRPVHWEPSEHGVQYSNSAPHAWVADLEITLEHRGASTLPGHSGHDGPLWQRDGGWSDGLSAVFLPAAVLARYGLRIVD